ncbi:MAG: hypothetical protein A3B68_01445 [Candidatus Melainabacteria bacterium RIFCSPHIGHO2_02_FULL_34_12]|nr:MAG: hypothetical protein A3B68_01445 [Candidatus Melainabacteria bacterium RIFCSPHIGHO2_02_FULL_34_12]
MFILYVIPGHLNPNNGSNNPSERLAEIRGKIAVAEQRVKDLEALLTALILGDDINFDGSGPPPVGERGPTDANSVRNALYQARAYEGELRTAEQFWNQIVDANKQAEKDTHDLFKRA